MRPPGNADAFDALLEQRIVFLRGALDERGAELAVAQLLHLDRLRSGAEIAIYINCPRADLRAALTVYDMMQAVHSPIRTVCLGAAAGGAAVVLAGGAAGRRGALPNARITFYEPRQEIAGTIGELDVRARELLRLRQQVHELLARHTGQPRERIERDAEREVWLGADEARTYGIIDEIVPAPRRPDQDEGSPS